MASVSEHPGLLLLGNSTDVTYGVVNSTNSSANEQTDCYSNDTSSQCANSTRLSLADAQWDKDMRIIALWIQISLGVLGGLAVCAWLWSNRRRKSRVNIIMLHVTISDLLVMGATLAQVAWEMADRWWLAGEAMCKIVKFYQSFSMMASSNMLVMLSLDRHQAILSPFRSPPPVWQMSLGFWLAAALLSVPMFFMFYVTTNDVPGSQFYKKVICESVFRIRPKIHRQVFLTSMSLIHVFIPCFVIAVCYVRIFLKISQKANEVDNKNVVLKPGKIHLQCTRSTLPKAKIKTLKMTVVIVSVFVICGLPYHILEMMYNFWSHVEVPQMVSAVLGALPVANSVMNPYIFLIFNTNYQSLKALFCRERPNEYKESKTNSLACTTKTVINVRYNDYNSTMIELTPQMINDTNKTASHEKRLLDN